MSGLGLELGLESLSLSMVKHRLNEADGKRKDVSEGGRWEEEGVGREEKGGEEG